MQLYQISSSKNKQTDGDVPKMFQHNIEVGKSIIGSTILYLETRALGTCRYVSTNITNSSNFGVCAIPPPLLSSTGSSYVYRYCNNVLIYIR